MKITKKRFNILKIINNNPLRLSGNKICIKAKITQCIGMNAINDFVKLNILLKHDHDKRENRYELTPKGKKIYLLELKRLGVEI